MTIGGIALFAGGITILISFRSVLFGFDRHEDEEAAPADHQKPEPEPTVRKPRPTPARAPEWPGRSHHEPTQRPTDLPSTRTAAEVVVSWPPINDRRVGSWSARNVNSVPGFPRVVFPGGPGDRPTVLERRRPAPHPRTPYVSRHAADPPR